jgi:hypothetical protein
MSRQRPAIAMIELIFAIVVIGITLMSVPNLIFTAQKSGYVAIQQEAINEASTHLNMVMGYHWDENDSDERFLDPILHVSNGDSNLSEYNNSGRRAGTPEESYRKFIRSDGSELNASAIGKDGESQGDEDDIDDFNGETYHLTLIETTNNSWEDYVEREENISIATVVSYIADIPGSGGYTDPGGDNKITFNFDPSAATPTTNIKAITVTLTSSSGISELEKNITIRAFSCNIGATELEERHF